MANGTIIAITLMRKFKTRQFMRQTLIGLLLTVFPVSAAMAVTSSSENYQMTDGQFNSGMTLDSCSAEYCAQATIGDIVAGQGAGSVEGSTTASFGTTFDENPLLEVIIEPGESDLGILTTERTATKTTNIKIRSYLSDGYTLQIVGEPPRYGDYQLRTTNTPEVSQPGTELFGINAVANTSPSIGRDPVQIPSDEFSFGEVLAGYNLPNFFKFRSGDVIAQSLAESGQTEYTISMIVNVSGRTPAGHFAGDYAAVVVPYY